MQFENNTSLLAVKIYTGRHPPKIRFIFPFGLSHYRLKFMAIDYSKTTLRPAQMLPACLGNWILKTIPFIPYEL